MKIPDMRLVSFSEALDTDSILETLQCHSGL